MEKIDLDSLSKYSDDELKKIKQFAMMPTGALGIHDFMLGRKIEGVLHIVLTFIVFLFCNGLGEMVCKSVGNCNTGGEIETFYRSTLVLGMLFAIGSYVWAIFEGDAINGIIKSRHQPMQKEPSPAETQKLKEVELQNKRKEKKTTTTLSVIFGVIAAIIQPLFVLLLSILHKSNVMPCDQGSCEAIILPIGFFVVYIITPYSAIMAIIFGIISLSKREDGRVHWILPFLGMLLGFIGIFLIWDYFFGHLIITSLWIK